MTLLADFRWALRSLRRRPGFTAAAAGILALGIGASTAVFSVVDAVLLRPLPYRHAERVVIAFADGSARGRAGLPRRDARPVGPALRRRARRSGDARRGGGPAAGRGGGSVPGARAAGEPRRPAGRVARVSKDGGERAALTTDRRFRQMGFQVAP
jgi:prepilin-type processing-associated H-X9-DG protein